MTKTERFKKNEEMLVDMLGEQVSETKATPDNKYVELVFANGKRIIIQAVRVKMPDGSTEAELAIVDSTAKATLL